MQIKFQQSLQVSHTSGPELWYPVAEETHSDFEGSLARYTGRESSQNRIAELYK